MNKHKNIIDMNIQGEEGQEDKVDRDSLEQGEMVLNPSYLRF